MSTSYATEKGWVKEAIANTWSKAEPKIQFVGWDACPATSDGIRIKIDHAIGGHTNGFGAVLAGMPNGVQLSIDIPAFLRNQPPNDARAGCVASVDTTKACVQSIAIHEFGHALGLMHEQNRSDVASGCDKFAPYQSLSGQAIGAFDPDSIMNYCANLHNLQQTYLSAGDKMAIVAFYAGDVGRLDPGRPALTQSQANIDVSTLVWGYDATLTVAYNSSPKIDAASLPDPASALALTNAKGKQVIPCGPWVVTPISDSLDIKTTHCPYTANASGPQNLGDFQWQSKFLATANVGVAAAAYQDLTDGPSAGLFTIEYEVLIAPNAGTPQLSMTAAIALTPQQIALSPVACGPGPMPGSYLCTANSLSSLPTGTFIKIDGSLTVGGTTTKLPSGYGATP